MNTQRVITAISATIRSNELIQGPYKTFLPEEFVQRSREVIDQQIPYRIQEFAKVVNLLTGENTLPENGLDIETSVQLLADNAELLDRLFSAPDKKDKTYKVISTGTGEISIGEVLLAAANNIITSGDIVHSYKRIAEITKTQG